MSPFARPIAKRKNEKSEILEVRDEGLEKARAFIADGG